MMLKMHWQHLVQPATSKQVTGSQPLQTTKRKKKGFAKEINTSSLEQRVSTATGEEDTPDNNSQIRQLTTID